MKSVKTFLAVFMVVLVLDFLWWRASRHLPPFITGENTDVAWVVPWVVIGLGVAVFVWIRDRSLLQVAALGAIAGTATAFTLINAYVLLGG